MYAAREGLMMVCKAYKWAATYKQSTIYNYIKSKNPEKNVRWIENWATEATGV
jgi:hypothetical protein